VTHQDAGAPDANTDYYMTVYGMLDTGTPLIGSFDVTGTGGTATLTMTPIASISGTSKAFATLIYED